LKKLKRIIKILILLTLLNKCNNSLFAQIRYLTLNSEIEELYYKTLYSPGSGFHTSIKPYSIEEIYSKVNYDTLFNKKTSKIKFFNKLLNDNFVVIEPKNFNTPYNVGVSFNKKHLSRYVVNPLINAIAGIEKDNGTKPIWEVGVGLTFYGDVTKNLSFSGSISLNQAVFGNYIYDRIHFSKSIPGMGYAYAMGDSIYRYIDANFMMAYKLSSNFQVETGYGKQFLGDGYRSLILSWNAPNYPYFKLTSKLWKFKYINVFSLYNDSKDITSANWKEYKYKFSAIHYLSFNIGKRFNGGIFEGVIWDVNTQNVDTRRIFDLYYLNPVIFYRPVEFSIGSPDNVIMGLNARMTLWQKTVVYSQVVLDEFVLGNIKNDFIAFVKRTLGKTDNLGEYGAWTNKQAYQIGLRQFDLFGIKKLNGLIEINAVRPYTYSHRRPIKNYSHFGQALAHPLGANFIEGVLCLKYNYKKYFVSASGIVVKTGLDGANQHNGQDIFKPTYDTYEPDYKNIPVTQLYNVIGQGIPTKIANATLKLSYLINTASQLRIESGINIRYFNSNNNINRAAIFFVGFKSGIDRYYRDF